MNIGIIGLGLMGASFAKRLSPQKIKRFMALTKISKQYKPLLN